MTERNYIRRKYGPDVPWWLFGAWGMGCTTAQAVRAKAACERLDWPADFYGVLKHIRYNDALEET